MPAPAVYVLAIVGTIAAGIAFKEFVYEPHIAPKLEQWAEEFIAKRQARRRQRSRAVPVAVPLQRGTVDKRSDSSDEGDETRQSIELEDLIAKEVHQWRSEVNRSQTLRHRGNADSSGSQHTQTVFTSSRLIPDSPTHVLFDPFVPLTPSSTLPSLDNSPSPKAPTLHESPSLSTLRSPPPPQAHRSLLTPTGSSQNQSPAAEFNTTLPVPSLSESYPFVTDHEQGLELLSAPSSRPDTPFSSFSHPTSEHGGAAASSSNYYSFSSPNATSQYLISSPLARPPSDLDFLSDFEPSPMSPHSTVSNISSVDELHVDDGTRSDSSWASASGRSR